MNKIEAEKMEERLRKIALIVSNSNRTCVTFIEESADDSLVGMMAADNFENVFLYNSMIRDYVDELLEMIAK